MLLEQVRKVIVDVDEGSNCVGADGEILPGPGPFTMTPLPACLQAFGEIN